MLTNAELLDVVHRQLGQLEAKVMYFDLLLVLCSTLFTVFILLRLYKY